jgi:MoaA/NifB/PqqE/SkfB family radical SAM enzyme
MSIGKSIFTNFKPSEILKEFGITANDDTFCILPWTHTSTTTNGDFRLCCRSSKVWTIQNIGIKDLWNHSKYQQIRDNLINGVRDPHCEACWKMEDNGIVSLRQTQNFQRLRKYIDLVRIWHETGWAKFEIPIVEFKLSNLCNLKCRMCWPKDSTPWIQDWDLVKHLYDKKESLYVDQIIKDNNLYKKPILNVFESNEQFVNDIFEILDFIEEFEFAGGEPLMDPLHFRMLEKIKHPEFVTLKYSTNLTNLESKKGRNVIDLWKKFKSVKLTVSIDGYPELNSYIRRGSDWNTIKNNIEIVKLELGSKLDYIKASTCISAYNVEYLVETLNAVRDDLNCYWHTSRLQWPSFLHANVLEISRLEIAKKKILNELNRFNSKNDGLDKSPEEANNKRHLSDAINWIDYCIENNANQENYEKFIEFEKLINKGTSA